jgi:putative addiction module killer protein/probable addiction module antidote protein
MIKKLLDNS